MRAVVLTGYGGPEVLAFQEVPLPDLRDSDVLVRVRAIGLNRSDLLQRSGGYVPYSPQKREILGLEFAGEVVESRHGWAQGARVMGIVPGSGYAQYVSVYHSHLIAIPAQLSFEEAAAIPEVWETAFQLTHMIGHISAGQRVLIHAAASGVGTALIQLVKDAGALGYATCGSDDKVQKCLEYGAHAACNYKTTDFSEWLQSSKADLIFDPILASNFSKNLASLNLDGKWVVYGALGGISVDNVNFRDLLNKRASLEFTLLRTRTDEYKAELVGEMQRKGVFEKFGSGVFKPVLHRVMDWGEVQEAHRILGANEAVGKIVLTVD